MAGGICSPGSKSLRCHLSSLAFFKNVDLFKLFNFTPNRRAVHVSKFSDFVDPYVEATLTDDLGNGPIIEPALLDKLKQAAPGAHSHREADLG